MDAETRDAIYRSCIDEYGVESQIDMTIEEMSELTKALLKWKRASSANKADLIKKRNRLAELRNDIIDEIADVRIMCRQMELLFKAEDEVEQRIDFKTDRQAMRLDMKMGRI